MADEIIDLTGSSPPRVRSNNSSRINRFHPYVSTRRFDFRRTLRLSCQNPNACNICKQMATWVPMQPSREINGAHQNTRGVGEPSNHDVSMHEPMTQSNATHLCPHGATLDKNWTTGEHELYVMGLKSYGRNQWNKISGNFVLSKTPQEVQIYEEKFFNLLPSTNSYGFNPSNNNITSGVEMGTNENLIGASSSTFSNAMMPNYEPPPTFPSFPRRGASTSPVANNEVDLELRLG